MEFHLGDEERVCLVDGDASEWTQEDVVIQTDAGSLSMQYDETYLYFYAQGDAFDPMQDTLYIPLDTLPDQGLSLIHI